MKDKNLVNEESAKIKENHGNAEKPADEQSFHKSEDRTHKEQFLPLVDIDKSKKVQEDDKQMNQDKGQVPEKQPHIVKSVMGKSTAAPETEVGIGKVEENKRIDFDPLKTNTDSGSKEKNCLQEKEVLSLSKCQEFEEATMKGLNPNVKETTNANKISTRVILHKYNACIF